MIYAETPNIRMNHTHHFSCLNKFQVEQLKESEENGGIVFAVPEHIKSNAEKSIYKTGFMAELLKYLYPEKSFSEICDIMGKRYDIFLSRRQIDRNVKKFRENKKFH